MKTFNYLIITIMMLASSAVYAQDQKQSTSSMGGGWSSGGSYTTFSVAGQNAVITSFIGGDFSGSIGFVTPQREASVENLNPVAITPGVILSYQLTSLITLEGFDPEGAAIRFEVVEAPKLGSISFPDQAVDYELVFVPNSNLETGIFYQDTVLFKVVEAGGSLESDFAQIVFEFQVEDIPHAIDDVVINNQSVTISIRDTLFNTDYVLDVNYYDLSDPTNPVFVNINNETVAKTALSITGVIGDYSFDVNNETHAYFFDTNQVLMTVLVATTNGYSAFESYVIDNTSGGRAQASEDGQFFVIGSEMSVPENKSVLLKMMAVDFADFDISTASFEWIGSPNWGTIGEVALAETSASLNVWEASYTSTQNIGGLDSIQFRVFNPSRNTYDSGFVKLIIADVNDLPSLVAIGDRQMDEDGTVDLSLTFEDPDNDLKVFASSSEASNVQTSIVGSVLTMTGLNDFNGLVNVSVWVEEVGTAEKYLRLESFTLDVKAVNDPPVIQQVAAQTALEDNSVVIALNATDPDTDIQVFTYQAYLDDPTLGDIEVVGNTLKVIPTLDAFGTTKVNVSASDGTTSSASPMVFDIEFTPVNDAPRLVQVMNTQIMVSGFPDYAIDMSGFFVDPETSNDQLIYSVGTSSNVSIGFSGSTATIATVAAGTEDITFTVSDGDLSVDMAVTFVVNVPNVNLAVANRIEDISLNEDFETYTISITDVFVDNSDPNAVFQYSILGNSFVSVSLDDMSEQISFDSSLDFNGSESLILIGTTSGNSVYTTFDLNVTAVNDAPVTGTLLSQSIQEDGALSNMVVSVSDVDTDGGLLTLTVTSSDQTIIKDADISVTNGTGYFTISAIPISNANGTLSLTTVLSDGDIDVASAFDMKVVSVNDLPSKVGELASQEEDKNVSIDIAQFFDDVDGDVLTYTVNQLPVWMTATGSVLSGTPSNSDVGLNQVDVTAADQSGQIRLTFDFQVTNTNDVPILVKPAGSLSVFSGDAFSYAFPVNAFTDEDVDDVLTYTFENIPTWATVDGMTLSGAPQDSDAGEMGVTLKATDQAGASVTDILTLSVVIKTYNAVVEFSAKTTCAGESNIVQASGAFDYVWYDVDDIVLQTGGSTYEFFPSENTTLKVAGMDDSGLQTESRYEVVIDVNALPNAVITSDGFDLSVVDDFESDYQWYFNGEIIEGATSSRITAMASGNYNVQVTNGFGCTATSELVEIIVLSTQQLFSELVIYPVPAQDLLTLEMGKQAIELDATVLDLSGQVLMVKSYLNGNRMLFDTSSLAKGIYILMIQAQQQSTKLKFIIE